MIFRGAKTMEDAPSVGAQQAHHAPATLQEDKAQGRIDAHQLVLARVGPSKGAKPGSRNPPHPRLTSVNFTMT
jgi:hypothetical protein